MRQPSMKCIPELINLGGLVVGGLEELEGELNLHYASAEPMSAELAEVVARQFTYGEAKQVMKTRSTAMKEAVKRTREFVRVTRDSLKPVLGYHYSQNWEALGFRNTLMIPMTAARLVPMMQLVVSYLTDHPERAVVDLKVTLAEAQSVLAELEGAQQGIAGQDTDLERLLTERNAHADQLRRSIRLLISELHNVLSPDDPRWFRFGLNQPSAQERPGTPKKPELQMMGDQLGGLKWPRVPSADRYRVYVKEVDSEAEPTPVATVYDPRCTAEALPPDKDLEVSISAVNSGGESRRSEAVLVKRKVAEAVAASPESGEAVEEARPVVEANPIAEPGSA